LDEAGLTSSVTVSKNVSREDKVKFYGECDVLSVPARNDEAFGLYIIESLAAGTPLVQPDCGSFPELLAATGGGVLCGANTSSALAATLDPLLRNPGRLRAMGRAGRESVFRNFTDTRMAESTIAALERLLGRRRAAAAP
jgi:glycosyltransferase involved in cell wall biosynthesis